MAVGLVAVSFGESMTYRTVGIQERWFSGMCLICRSGAIVSGLAGTRDRAYPTLALLASVFAIAGLIATALPASHAWAATGVPGLDTLDANLSCIAGARPDPVGSVSLPAVIDQWPGKGGPLLTIMVQNPAEPGMWLIGDKPGLLYNFRQGAPKFSRVGPAIDLSDRVTEMWKGTSPGWYAELGLLTAA